MGNHRITIHPVEVKGSRATIGWSIEPRLQLYIRDRFHLDFPGFIDLAKVPEALWWRIALICLHSQWPLLRPCEVRLPVRLNPGEAEVWSRLIESEIVSLEYYNGSRGESRRIEIVEEGPEVPAPDSVPGSGSCATSFSGGKDSLTQVGLLTEMGYKPALVMTTSPVPWNNDHKTWRRRRIIREIQRRREVTFVEIKTDFRRNFNYYVTPSLGVNVPMNIISDTLLYTGAMLAAGYALGSRHFFLAAENEVHEIKRVNGEAIQHPHYMYSVITQSALGAILAPLGISYCAMTSALRASQVQQLLWRRYPDLSDLQYSCWLAGRHQKICSRCPQCLRMALGAMGAGGDATRMGVNWIRLLNANADWNPRRVANLDSADNPRVSVGIHLDAQASRALMSIPPAEMAKAIRKSSPFSILTPAGRKALATFGLLRRRAIESEPGPPPGYRPGYLKYVDGLVRDRLESIYSSQFTAEDPELHAASLALIDEQINWITAPLGFRM